MRSPAAPRGGGVSAQGRGRWPPRRWSGDEDACALSPAAWPPIAVPVDAIRTPPASRFPKLSRYEGERSADAGEDEVEVGLPVGAVLRRLPACLDPVAVV